MAEAGLGKGAVLYRDGTDGVKKVGVRRRCGAVLMTRHESAEKHIPEVYIIFRISLFSVRLVFAQNLRFSKIRKIMYSSGSTAGEARG